MSKTTLCFGSPASSKNALISVATGNPSPRESLDSLSNDREMGYHQQDSVILAQGLVKDSKTRSA